jgi:hypothetical protein
VESRVSVSRRVTKERRKLASVSPASRNSKPWFERQSDAASAAIAFAHEAAWLRRLVEDDSLTRRVKIAGHLRRERGKRSASAKQGEKENSTYEPQWKSIFAAV